MSEKKLYKIEEDKKICGVCGGIAEYLNMDATIIRLLWVVLFFCGGSGFLLYIVFAFIMPNKSEIDPPII